MKLLFGIIIHHCALAVGRPLKLSRVPFLLSSFWSHGFYYNKIRFLYLFLLLFQRTGIFLMQLFLSGHSFSIRHLDFGSLVLKLRDGKRVAPSIRNLL